MCICDSQSGGRADWIGPWIRGCIEIHVFELSCRTNPRSWGYHSAQAPMLSERFLTRSANGAAAFAACGNDSQPPSACHITPLKWGDDRNVNSKGCQMSVALYDVSIPIFTLSLNNLAAILDKAASHSDEKKVDPKALAATRLIVDMLPLSAQVQIACDTAKGAAARLAGVEIPKHEDTEATISELKARIAKTLEFIRTIKPEQLQGAETREVILRFPESTLKFNGLNYLTNFALPNFFFHMTMAYALLRKNGVELGKRDFLGPIQ